VKRMLPSRSSCAVAVLLCAFAWRIGIAADAAPQPTFADWFKTWQTEGAQREPEVQKIAGEAAVLKYYADVAADIALMARRQHTPEEQGWIQNFQCALDADQEDQAALVQAQQSLAGTPEGAKPSAQTAAAFRALFKGDIFRSDNQSHDENFRILPLADRNSVLTPCVGIVEIRIAPNSTSVVAQQLFDKADRLTRLFALQNDPAMAATARIISDARGRWDTFFKNVLLDEFPWEIMANDALGSRVSALRGTLATPPGAQLRLAHPVPVIVGQTQGGSGAQPRVAAEVFGWRSYDPKTYAPKWGVSSLFVLKGSSSESNGYGLLLAAKNVSIGVVVQDTERKRNGVSIVLGVDFAKLLNNDVQSLRDRKTTLENGWKSLLDATSK
jgi:hypothetical protein